MSTSTIITLVCVILFLYGGTGFAIYKTMTIKHDDQEKTEE